MKSLISLNFLACVVGAVGFFFVEKLVLVCREPRLFLDSRVGLSSSSSLELSLLSELLSSSLRGARPLIAKSSSVGLY